MTERVLVTGGAGFVGSHVVDALVAGGHEVRVLDLFHPAAHSEPPAYLNPGAELVRADVRDPDVVDRCTDAITAVSHQAAMVGLGSGFSDIADYVGHNDLGTAQLLRGLAARHFTGRFVLAGSMVVYGEGRYRCPEHGELRPPARRREDLDAGRFDPLCPCCDRALEALAIDESAAPDPRNVYAVTKLAQEQLCSVFARELDIPLTTLRYHNVYGPRMPRDTPYAGVASIFRSATAAGRAPTVFEDGRQLRDFVHVRDVARANVLALTADRPAPGVFNIASGTPRSIGELAAALASAASPPAPDPVVTGEYRLGDVRHVLASPERAHDGLGFAAEVPWAEGIGEFAGATLRA